MNVSNNSNCSCPENLVDSWSSLLEKILIPTIGGLGLLGNLVAILVLKYPELKSTFHQSLQTLAVCDVFMLFFLLTDIFLDTSHKVYIYMFPYFWNPLRNIIMSWETFLIMSISTERFFAVCEPVLYRRHKLRFSPRIHLMTYILPGLVCATLLNIPKFLELELVTKKSGRVDYKATALRLDQDYIYYYTHWTRLLATGVVPIFYLAITNLAIFFKIRKGMTKSGTLRESSRSIQMPRHSSRKPILVKKVKTPSNSALTLTAIVVLYLICNLPRLTLNLVEYLLISEIYQIDECGCYMAPWWLSSLIRISHLLLTINSSINFIIYVLVSKVFKKVFKTRRQNCLKSLRKQFCSDPQIVVKVLSEEPNLTEVEIIGREALNEETL